jgi:hypothetical protein
MATTSTPKDTQTKDAPPAAPAKAAAPAAPKKPAGPSVKPIVPVSDPKTGLAVKVAEKKK